MTEPECAKFVHGGAMTYKCRETLDHEGPCAAPELPRTVKARQQWQAGQEARATLDQFQGRPRTTAEAYTDNPAPVPGGPSPDPADYPETMATRPWTLTCESCISGDHRNCRGTPCPCYNRDPVDHDVMRHDVNASTSLGRYQFVSNTWTSDGNDTAPSGQSIYDDVEWMRLFVNALTSTGDIAPDLLAEARTRSIRMVNRMVSLRIITGRDG